MTKIFIFQYGTGNKKFMVYMTIHSQAYGKGFLWSTLKSIKWFILIGFKTDPLNTQSVTNFPLYAVVQDTEKWNGFDSRSVSIWQQRAVADKSTCLHLCGTAWDRSLRLQSFGQYGVMWFFMVSLFDMVIWRYGSFDRKALLEEITSFIRQTV